MMDYFKHFSSNTLAGSGNQHFFRNEDKEKITRCCCLYKVFAGGTFPYAFLFSNTIDSTYSNGAVSHKNLVLDSWIIEEMRVGVTVTCDPESFVYPTEMKQVLFAGQTRRTVNPGELFASDAVVLTAEKDAYLCLEIAFSGGQIPYHDESIIPSFLWDGEAWIPSKLHPFASMVGAARPVKKKIAFLGDSITQGIGTPVNSYAHWNAVFSQGLGQENAYWNLGLGFGRADDAASDGIWLYKAKQNDTVFVCYGVNDILQGYSAESIKKNLQTIVDKLAEAGVRVILQTVPPFDYSPARRPIWEDVNRFILQELNHADFVFDCVGCLGDAEQPHRAKFGGHPDAAGCKIWGETLLDAVLSADALR